MGGGLGYGHRPFVHCGLLRNSTIFRYAANWLTSRNYSVKELSYENVAQDQVNSIVDSWRKSKSVRTESTFLNRPFTFVDEPGVRTFFLLDPDEKAVALSTLFSLLGLGSNFGHFA